jgi:hypothetical protein
MSAHIDAVVVCRMSDPELRCLPVKRAAGGGTHRHHIALDSSQALQNPHKKKTWVCDVSGGEVAATRTKVTAENLQSQ